MRRLFVPIALALCAALPATADTTNLARMDRVVSAVTVADMRAMLNVDGYEILDQGQTDRFWVAARDATQLNFFIGGAACSDDGCLGLNIFVPFETAGQISMSRVNEANERWAAVKMTVDAEDERNVLYVSRYLILDGGATVENVLENLDVTLAIAPEVEAFVFN